MKPEVKIERRGAGKALVRRSSVTLSGIGPAIGEAFGEIYRHLGERGGRPAGPPFVVYPESPSPDRPFEIEICAPVAGPVDAPPGWQLRELPAAEVAALLHVGPYDSIGASYAALTAWIENQGRSPVGPPREIYLSPPETPPDRIQTLIEIPVAAPEAPSATGAP
jgi:effector-binding domain-containing protein